MIAKSVVVGKMLQDEFGVRYPSNRLAFRAPNNTCSGQVGTRRVILAFFVAFSFFRFDSESRPSHLPLTPAVGRLVGKIRRHQNCGGIMRSVDNEKVKSASHNFMLEEYKVLRERSRSMNDGAAVRLNFYIGLTSALLGGSLVLGNNAALSPLMFKLLLLIELFILTVIGLDVFHSVVLRNEVVDKAERGMSRIRQYFIRKDPSLADFITYRISDEPTFWVTNHSGAGMRRTTQMLVSFTVGLGTGILANLINVMLFAAVAIGILSSLIAFIALEYSARRQLKQALREAQGEIRFGKQTKLSNAKR